MIGIIGLVLGSEAMAQNEITEQKLLGSWLVVSHSLLQETLTLTFKDENELLISTVQSKRNGKPITPITNTSNAAYKFGSGACSVEQEIGNLFLAKGSTRCCFNIYQIGPTLVFDEVRVGSQYLPPGSMCEGKTLRKVSR